ncbi:MAG: tetraacyldisaccharide 4'-kinase [Verrucomicrobiales bacterium]
MKETLEQLEQYGIEVILGRINTLRARLLRGALWILSRVYGRLVRLRLWLFRGRYIRDHDLGCMVISIGNLTVGGTGKTPVVEMFARALHERGRNVAILSRGYKSEQEKKKKKRRPFGSKAPELPPRVVSDGNEVLLDSLRAGDEPYMLAVNLPGVPVVVDKNRVKGGRHAIRDLGADTLLLDDGLQYVRMRRRLDVVLVDCTAPFGNEYLLPRGTLREPPPNLRRASYILLTKCNGEPNDAIIGRIRHYNRTAEIIECAHRPRYLQHLKTGERLELSEIQGKFVGAISGIAVPEGFENGLRKLGATVEIAERYADHHRFNEKEVAAFLDRCLRRDLHMVVTTEKDAVRFPLPASLDIPVYFLRIDIDILNGREHFEACIRRVCQPPKR